MSQSEAPRNRLQESTAVSRHQKLIFSPSNRHILKAEEIEKIAPSPLHAIRGEDENIQSEFTRIVKKQAQIRFHSIPRSDSEELLKSPSNTEKKRIDDLVKNSAKRFGLTKKDKEYQFNRNLDGFKHLNTYFEISDLMKPTAFTSPNIQNRQRTVEKTGIYHDPIELPQITKISSEIYRAEPLSDIPAEESHLEKGKSLNSQTKHTNSMPSLARTLADQALEKAKDRSRFIAMMDRCSSIQKLKTLKSTHRKKFNSMILIDHQNDANSNTNSIDDDELFEEQKKMQRARDEVERDWEAHQQLRVDFKKGQLLQSLIRCIESLKLNREGNGVLNENFQARFFQLLEERLRDSKTTIELAKFSKQEEKELQFLLDSLQAHFPKSSNRKLDSDVKLAEELNSQRLRSTKVIALLKGLTKRILRHDCMPRPEQNTSHTIPQESDFGSFIIHSKEKTSMPDLSSNTLILNQTRSHSEKKHPTSNFSKNSPLIQIPRRNISKNLTASFLSPLISPAPKFNELESNKVRKEANSEILNPKKQLLLLKQVPSIENLKENDETDPHNEISLHTRERRSTIRFSESPLRSPSTVDISKVKSKVASKSYTSSPQLKTIGNLEATNSEKKIMKFNDRLLEIEKQSESIQKATHRQLKKIDRQSDKLGHFYNKKYREYLLKIDNVPANLLKNSLHERYNNMKRREFKNSLTKKVLNAVLD